MYQLQRLTGCWMLALAPLLFVLGCFRTVRRGKVFVLAGLLVSVPAMVIPVRGISLAQSRSIRRPICLATECSNG